MVMVVVVVMVMMIVMTMIVIVMVRRRLQCHFCKLAQCLSDRSIMAAMFFPLLTTRRMPHG
jgi:hypothetical protein